MQTGPPTARPTTVRVALIVAVAVVLLAVAELTSDGFSEFIQDHALISTFVAEAILLVAVYLVIDEVFQSQRNAPVGRRDFVGGARPRRACIRAR